MEEEAAISSLSMTKKSVVAGREIFDLTFEHDSTAAVVDKSVSDIWNVSSCVDAF